MNRKEKKDLEKLEDQLDIEAFDKSYKEYQKDKKTYSNEEANKILSN